jgi:acetolactate synthase-1/2/3 large subunit
VRDYKRPVILLGYGARHASQESLDALMLAGIPVLTSWQAADLVDNHHAAYFGRPGIYGQRAANRILYEADLVVAVGNRCAIWEIGHDGFRPEQDVWMVDVDGMEVEKVKGAVWIAQDAAKWLESRWEIRCPLEWLATCASWREKWPLHDNQQDYSNGRINVYAFMARLQRFLKSDQIIVTDVGAAVCAAFQVLRLKPPQRMLTSGGLGEMGCGLPAAIGASYARNRGEVLCLAGDGGMMLNLQELQTIAHNALPVKIIVFANDGYAMIKRTQKNLFMPYTGVDAASGVSCPDFRKLAHGFGIASADVRNFDDFGYAMPQFMASDEPQLLQVHIDAEQEYLKLQPLVGTDGKITAPKFYELSPACT